MAERTDAGEMSSFDPSYGSEAKKRPLSSDGGDEPMRKMPVTKFGSRPQFEPVHFVSGGSSGGFGTDEKENNKERRKSESHGVRHWDSQHTTSSFYSSTSRAQGFSSLRPAFDRMPSHSSDFWGSHRDGEISSGSTSGLGYGGHGSSSNYMSKTQQDYTAKYEAHASFHSLDSYSKPQRFNGHGGGSRTGGWDSGRQGLGYGHQDRPSSSGPFSRVYNSPGRSSPNVCLPGPSQPHLVSQLTLDEKQRLIASVANALAIAFRNPVLITGSDSPNYNFMLSRSIQACKTNPEYIYVNLKDIPPADLPKNRKVPTDGYACELRCQGVYLATGYSGSKNGARDRASEQAVKLFLKPVEVRLVQRKYRRLIVNDMVVCQMHSPTPPFLPALRNPEDKPAPSSKNQHEPDRHKHWTEFVVMDNAHDAICILNNSNAFNRMKIDYKFDQLPNNMWVCSVFLQDELVAQATGTKKSSKHAAAEAAVNKLRMNQAQREHQQQQQQSQSSRGNNQSHIGGHVGQQGNKKQLSELVILENSDNAICIINDTAQFNKVTADYKFSVLPDHRWKCEVYLEGQYVAAGVGPKKMVKHIAANEALATLRRTQAVVKSNLRKEGHNDTISRSQIQGRSGEEAIKQEIKEDNIGNQLLRKMGWKGGGLGRDGEGIAEPIRVKEQFSREGLGMDTDKNGNQLAKRDIEDIIRNYASSDRTDDLRFSNELTNDERKQIHQVSQKYGLRSKSYGQGWQRFLVVSRKVHKDQLIGQLLQEGQVGRYELVKPQASH
uniref:NF-kappa B repressing factor n=1 Tax=Nothobranchius rachovii TaxID=451742 RepID=A0A1A8SAW7_9TELE